MNARSSRQPRARRPLPRGPLYTPGASDTRRSVETRSARVLLLLHQQPRWLVAAAAPVLLIAGLAVPGLAGAALLTALAVLLGWLAYLSWLTVPAQGRVLRVAAIAAVLVLAVVQFRR